MDVIQLDNGLSIGPVPNRKGIYLRITDKQGTRALSRFTGEEEVRIYLRSIGYSEGGFW